MKTYSELISLDDYQDRLDYLYIGDRVGRETFGSDRWLNQSLYTSTEWRTLRRDIIIRDLGCDLGVEGCGLDKKDIIVHHINPITPDDIINKRACVFDPNNLISVSRKTHLFIHYGAVNEIPVVIERTPNDTCPWRR